MTVPLKRIAPRSGFALGGAVHRIALSISLAMVASPFVLGVMTQPRTVGGFRSSKRDIAQATVHKFAHEAYPQWKHEHPARAYLASLGELCEYMNSRGTTDPWGGPYLTQRTPAESS